MLTILAAVCAGSPSAARAQGGHIELIGASTPQSISLAVHQRKPPGHKHGKLVLEGTLRLTLQNTAAKDQRLFVMLVSDALGGPRQLGKATLPPHSLRQLTLPVELPSGAEPGALDGTVLIDSHPLGSAKYSRLSLPVTATVAPIGDVRFAPDPAPVQVTRWCLIFNCNTRNGGNVQLSGAGVSALLTELSAAGVSSLHTKLRSGSNVLNAELTNLHAESNRPGVATAKLQLDSKPPPGKFTGSVALSPLLPQAPALAVEVNSRYMFAWAVLGILLGVFAAGYLYQQLGLSRRKRLLREMMWRTINLEYCPWQSENKVDGLRGSEKLIWDPELNCPLEDNPEWTYTTELEKSSDIYTAIYWARNDADLDEAQAAAVKVVKDVKSWLLAIADVRALWGLTQQKRPLEPEWKATITAMDSQLLLLKAKHTPPDPTTCGDLLAKVARQITWHRAFAEAWDLRAALLKGNEEIQGKASAVNLAALDEGAEPVMSRTADQQDTLSYKLDALYSELLILAKADPAVEPVQAEAALKGEADREAVSERLRGEIAYLHNTTPLTYALISAGRVIGPTDRQEPAPETEAEPPRTSLASAEAGLAKWLERRKDRPKPPRGTNGRATLARRLRLLDWVLSLAIVLATSLIYAAGIYGPDWGSIQDLGTAFGAGFGGQVGVKWALLPLYRSLRLRSPTAPAAAAEA